MVFENQMNNEFRQKYYIYSINKRLKSLNDEKKNFLRENEDRFHQSFSVIRKRIIFQFVC